MSADNIDNNPTPLPDPDSLNLPETLIVPPPHYRERLLAAQRARASEVRPSTDIPMPAQRMVDRLDDPEQDESASGHS